MIKGSNTVKLGAEALKGKLEKKLEEIGTMWSFRSIEPVTIVDSNVTFEFTTGRGTRVTGCVSVLETWEFMHKIEPADAPFANGITKLLETTVEKLFIEN